MNETDYALLFSFLEVTAVTRRYDATAKEKAARKVLAAFSYVIAGRGKKSAPTGLLRFSVRDPAGTRHFPFFLIVVEEFHLVIGLRARHWMIVHRTEARLVE